MSVFSCFSFSLMIWSLNGIEEERGKAEEHNAALSLMLKCRALISLEYLNSVISGKGTRSFSLNTFSVIATEYLRFTHFVPRRNWNWLKTTARKRQSHSKFFGGATNVEPRDRMRFLGELFLKVGVTNYRFHKMPQDKGFYVVYKWIKFEKKSSSKEISLDVHLLFSSLF